MLKGEPTVTAQTIVCPHCDKEFGLSELVTHELEEKIRAGMEEGLEQRRARIAAKEKAVAEGEKALAMHRETLAAELEERTQQARSELQKTIREEEKARVGVELEDLRNANEEKNGELKKAAQAELALRKRERALKQREDEVELEAERKFAEEREKLVAAAKKAASEGAELKIADMDKTIRDLNGQLKDAQQRLEQGSQEAQGTVLEGKLREMLQGSCPGDDIKPVPKGVSGADILQCVRLSSGHDCGTIIWESKRTKTWNQAWIETLKDNQRREGAQVAVLATQALPKGAANGFAVIDDVWVTDWHFAVPVALMLRDQLVKLARKQLQAGVPDGPRDIVYQYLTSDQFAHRVEAIVNAFHSMREDLRREQASIQKQWAKRHMQIDKVMVNAAGMYGDLQGIIGDTMPRVDGLELLALPEPGE